MSVRLRADIDPGEIQTLIAILREQGIHYLVASAPPPAGTSTAVDAVELLLRLAGCNDPLVEHAVIALLILHPELAPAAQEALQRGEGEVRERLAALLLATLYLQRWWLFRLAFALGRLPAFPEEPLAALWEERQLPAPSLDGGRAGLFALEEYLQRRCGLPLNFRADWQNQIDHLLEQEEARRRVVPSDVVEALRQMSREALEQPPQSE
jgi:chromosome condensin MukBEF ATPase and DNA-binding subunit MukB